MQDKGKTKDQLIDELNEMRRRVAELETTQKSLSEEESRYREIVEKTNQAIFIIQNGRIKFVNKATTELTGYLQDEALASLAIETFVHPDDQDMVNQYYVRRLQGDDAPLRYEYRFVCKDRTLKWAEMTSFLIMWKGKPADLCLVTDITERKQAEDSLSKSERKYRLLFDTAPIGIMLVDTEGKILEVNRSTLKILGSPGTEATKAINVLTFPPLVEAGISDFVRTCMTENRPIETELFYTSKWGKEICLRIISTPKLTEQGCVEGYLSIMEDVMPRKQAEEELRKSEEKYRLIFENSPLGIVHFNFNGMVTDCNQALLEIMGSSKEQMGGLNLLTSLKNEEVKKAIESALSGKVGQFDGEYKSVTGHKMSWLNLEYAPAIGRDGLVSGGIGIFQDISERKRAEKALRESESQKQAILDGITTNIAFVNPDMEILWANKTAADSVGKFPSQIIGQKCHSLWADDAKPCDGCPTFKAFKTKKSEHTIMVTPDGRVWDEKGEPVFDAEGSLLGVVEIATDITEKMRTEQEKEALQAQLFQSQKMEALGTLVGGIAHDFNNMLQIILGYSELLLIGKKKDDPAYKGLESIIQTSRGGAELVKKLLALGQQGQIIPVPLDLNHQISQMTSLISRTLPQVVQLDVDLTHGPVTIHADPNQIDQVVMNLAINASEAMSNGGGLKIATTTGSLDDEYCRRHHGAKPGNYVMLSVKDTGRGMDKETLARIFDPFFSTKERGSTRGTGLGLSVVQGIVQQQGGHVTCESEPGKGTEFKVYFPAIEAPLMTAKTVAPTVQSEGAETILVVEDTLSVAELEEQILRNAGYTVIIATRGQEALEIYHTRKDEISLVILDLLMPEMSGRDCLMELLKIDPSVKVLIASGYSPEDELHREISPLVKGFLHKPFGLTQLLDAVGAVLRDIEFG